MAQDAVLVFAAPYLMAACVVRNYGLLDKCRDLLCLVYAGMKCDAFVRVPLQPVVAEAMVRAVCAVSGFDATR